MRGTGGDDVTESRTGELKLLGGAAAADATVISERGP